MPYAFFAFASRLKRSAPFALSSLLFTLCPMLYALCAMLAVPLGVRRFFKQVSHKAPLTHIEGGAFLFCSGKPNSSIVIHSRKHRFEDYLDQLTKGKEPGKVRIVLE